MAHLLMGYFYSDIDLILSPVQTLQLRQSPIQAALYAACDASLLISVVLPVRQSLQKFAVVVLWLQMFLAQLDSDTKGKSHYPVHT